jgi:hypothetical protein
MTFGQEKWQTKRQAILNEEAAKKQALTDKFAEVYSKLQAHRENWLSVFDHPPSGLEIREIPNEFLEDKTMLDRTFSFPGEEGKIIRVRWLCDPSTYATGGVQVGPFLIIPDGRSNLGDTSDNEIDLDLAQSREKDIQEYWEQFNKSYPQNPKS